MVSHFTWYLCLTNNSLQLLRGRKTEELTEICHVEMDGKGGVSVVRVEGQVLQDDLALGAEAGLPDFMLSLCFECPLPLPPEEACFQTLCMIHPKEPRSDDLLCIVLKRM